MSKIHQRLRKLLNLAKCQSDTPEGDLAAALAAKMMKEHMIREEELVEEDKEKVVHLHQDTKVSNVWWSILFHAVGQYTNVEVAYQAVRGGRYITFVGYPHDIEVCKFLYDSIKHQLETEWKQLKARYKAEKTYPWQQTSKKDFLLPPLLRWALGCVGSSEKEHDDFNETETSIILARESKVKDFVANLGWGRGSRYRYGNSSEGRAAGERVKIQNGLAGSRRLKG